MAAGARAAALAGAAAAAAALLATLCDALRCKLLSPRWPLEPRMTIARGAGGQGLVHRCTGSRVSTTCCDPEVVGLSSESHRPRSAAAPSLSAHICTS